MSQYALGRGFASSVRLNCQHWMMTYTTGYLVHPDIPAFPDGLKIADIGTGTGMWLIELSKKVAPSAQLDGFDISVDQYPVKEWLPKNVSLHTLDALSSLPENLVGIYDIVHIRLFCLVIKSREELRTLTRNLIGMLKPGGYLQWDDSDPTNMKASAINTSIPQTYSDQLLEISVAAYTKASLKRDWIRSLGPLFKENGLAIIADCRYGIPTELRKPWSDNMLMSFEEISYHMMKTRDDEERAKAVAYRELLDRASEETARGVSIGLDLVTVVGKKPL